MGNQWTGQLPPHVSKQVSLQNWDLHSPTGCTANSKFTGNLFKAKLLHQTQLLNTGFPVCKEKVIWVFSRILKRSLQIPKGCASHGYHCTNTEFSVHICY